MIATFPDGLHSAHELAAATGAVKNAKEANAYLFGAGWGLPGETFALDILARTLFSVASAEKLPLTASNAIKAVAFLLTENIETKSTLDFSQKFADSTRTTLDALTTQLYDKIDLHIKTSVESTHAHAQSTLTTNLQQAQERFASSTQQTINNARSYSQVAASSLNANSTHPPHHFSLSQYQIRNREQIKKKQVLVDFSANLNLDVMNQDTLSRKAADAVNTAWAISDPKPSSQPKIKAATLMRNGGLLLEFDSEASANWLREEANSACFASNVGSGACIKNRSYQVIVQFAPIQFNPTDNTHLRDFEETNGLSPNSVLKAEWIKNPRDRRQAQKVATLRIYLNDAKAANMILGKGASIHGKRTVPKKPKKEPIRCLKCQRFGHERRACKSESPRCALCSEEHESDNCFVRLEDRVCANCQGNHTSFDRECSIFRDKCRQTDARCPENTLAFYPTDDPWSWATINYDVLPDPPPNHLPPPPGRPGGSRPPNFPGNNRAGTGFDFHAQNRQSHPPAFQ